jgi:hypothetical protein
MPRLEMTDSGMDIILKMSSAEFDPITKNGLNKILVPSMSLCY